MVGVRSTRQSYFGILCHPKFWPIDVLRWFFAMIFVVLLPIYFFIGFQPAASLDTANYPLLSIQDINLETPVQPLSLTAQHELIAPVNLAGSYQSNPNTTLIIGHSSTVFQNLHNISIGKQLTYANQTYRIVNVTTLPKDDINMSTLLESNALPTLILMTCAGDPLPNQDATHRLILTATLISSD